MKRTALLAIGSAAVAAVLVATLTGSGSVAAANGPGRNRPILELITSGTITVPQAREVVQALLAARPTDASSVRVEVLKSPVTSGTLNRTQANAILAVDGPEALRALVTSGMVSFAQAAAIRDAVRAELAEYADARIARRAAVLAGLVSVGTITPAQSDAIVASIYAAKAALARR